MNIALIGPSGTEKAAISRLLAKSMDKKLISTDEELKKTIKLSASKFIKIYGLERLRTVETDVVENITNLDECIFDAGEGVVMRNENIINLKRDGLIIFLTANTKILASSRKISRNPSNAFPNINFPEFEAKCKKAADYTIDISNLTPEEACGLISHYVQMEIQ